MKRFVYIFLFFISCINSSKNDIRIEHRDERGLKILDYYNAGGKKVREEGFNRASGTGDLIYVIYYYYLNGNIYTKQTDFCKTGKKEFEVIEKNEESLITIFYYSNGMKFNQNNEFEDKWSFWYENGQLRTMSDNKTGIYRGYYEDGNIRIAGYMKDYLADSVWSYFSPSGEIVQQIVYRENKIVERKIFDSLATESFFTEEEY
jgi:antitoxin component YwqK of YwqJK toxin-antitoxin module